MAKPRIICVGAAHWDLIARSDRKLSMGDDVPGHILQRPGGVALNVALGVAARGVATGLISVLGEDDAGASLIGLAEAAGADCAGILRIKGAPTSRYLAIENAEGDLFAAVADVDLLETHASAVIEQCERAVSEADVLFLDANLPEFAIEKIASHAAASGVEIVANPVSPAKSARLKSLLSEAYSPTIVANLAEADALLQTTVTNAPDAASALLAHGAGTALVTDGARPAALATPEGVVVSTPPALSGAVSVTGAGDAFLAGYLAFPGRQSNPEAALATALRAAAEHMTVG
ncbi:MAG: PfkB family carbohydrate kinase [Pseudomonadota bacterium]